MNNFNYPSEIIFGKKHLQNISFDKEKYNLVYILEKLFNHKLSKLHELVDEYKWDGKDNLGMDTHTILHKKFYKRIDEGWDNLKDTYEKFAKEILLPYLGLNEALLQVHPNIRLQFPKNKAITVPHFDSDDLHHHPYGEINFIYALTDMFDTNTIWVEKNCRRQDYVPIEQKEGECMSFGGNTYTHFNKLNKTDVTRVSFDFRILPLNYYDPENKLISVTKKSHYIEGGYYKRISQNLKLYKAIDIWDKEKEKFNSTMIKFGAKSAWDVVNIFEKKWQNMQEVNMLLQ